MSPSLTGRILNHWTTREAPQAPVLKGQGTSGPSLTPDPMGSLPSTRPCHQQMRISMIMPSSPLPAPPDALKWGASGLALPLPISRVSYPLGYVLLVRFTFASLVQGMSSVQSLSRVQLFATPWTAARQTSPSITKSWSLIKLKSIKSAMPSNRLILCHPLLLPPSIFPSIRVFSNKSVLCIRWLKYWSFSFSISPSNEYSGLISFMNDTQQMGT